MAPHSVFWDTNILIDFLLERPHELAAVSEIFERAHTGDVDIFTCESAITTSIYVCRGTPVVKALLVFLEYAQVLPANHEAVVDALSSSFKDKEDAILYYLAAHHRVDTFITRDKKDFPKAALTSTVVMTPREFSRKFK